MHPSERESRDPVRDGKRNFGLGRTITSTVSYRFKTTPSSSTMGTAEMERSENMWTTSKTEVSMLAVAIGQYG